MKCIRTKDGIYKSKRNPIEKDCLVIGKKENGKLGLIVKDIIAKADTIEELCDEFVVFGEHIIPSHTHFLSLTDIGIKSCLEAKAIIYGAIWTDKGLIFVAQLTEKGWKLL